MPYNTHALDVLEYGRMLEIIAGLADSAEAKARIRESLPLDDVAKVRGLLAEVHECIQAYRFDDVPPSFALHDIRPVFPHLAIQGYVLEIEDISAIADNLETARSVRGYFAERADKYSLLSSIAAGLAQLDDLIAAIRRAVTPDFTVDDHASPELRSIRRRLANARAALRSLVEKALSSFDDEVIADRIVTIRNGRFVIPVREGMKKRVPGAVHDRSQTGKTLFIEPLASIEANNLVNELEMGESAEIHRILADLSRRIVENLSGIRRNQEILVRFDVISAKARYGARVDGFVAAVSDTPEIIIKRGRHPLLDWRLRKSGDKDAVVPLDITLGGEKRTVVVTGPNAGGKTVAIKTVGLFTLMTLNGIPVPAIEGTTVFVPDGIFADIGDEQSIEDDLSTFSSHMRHIVTVVRQADEGSLVLLDELGGGTNPSDGEAIALAILETLNDRRSLTIATTHHGGLKVFAHETPGAVNASMEFDNERLRPSFVLRMGVPGSSYAFEIARRMEMPEDVLARAESIAGGERKTLEGLISELEEHVRRADDERRAAESERLELERLRRENERLRKEFDERRNELLSSAVADSRNVVEDANRRIESAIRAIRDSEASREAIVQAKKDIVDVRDDIEKTADRIPKKPQTRKRLKNPAPGDYAWVESLGGEVTVEEIIDGGRARVRKGKSPASVVISAKNLSEPDTRTRRAEQTVQVRVGSTAAESNEIDLRGLTFDEARDLVETFLDRVRMTGFETAHIIHGKGTGALRKKIGVYLDKHPAVLEHRLGYWNEGSSGVTVVTLKR